MIRLTHVVRERWQWRLIVVWFATLILTGHAMADQSLTGTSVTLYVTDRGINQKEELRLHAGEPRHWTMSKVAPQARIAVVMPDDKDFLFQSRSAMQEKIFQDLRTQVDQSMSAGLNEFEIQLIQDINRAGYISLGPDNRQAMVDRFGKAAYGAMTDLNRYLRENGVQVTNRAIVGSNGAKVFVANIAAWLLNGESIWHSVDFFDGRSHLTPTVEAIRMIGESRVRIFNTAGDLWAPSFPWGLSSIASRSTARHIKDHYFPELKVYQLSLIGKLPDGNHISGMTDSNSFKVAEYKGFAEGVQQVVGKFSGLALRQTLPASVPRSLPQDQEDSIAVWRTSAEDFVGVMNALGDYSKEEHRLGQSATPLLKGTHGGYRLVNAMMKDLEGAGDLDYVHLSSNTVEELIKWTVDQVRETDFAKRPTSKLFFRQIEAYKEFFSGGMDVWRTKTLNADAATKIDRGVIEVFKQEWREHNPELKAARWQVRKMEREVHAAQQALENKQRQLYRWAKNPKMLRTQETEVERLVDKLNNRKAALAAAKSAEQLQLTPLMFLDVLPELAGALTEHVSEGHLTINVADRYSDALVLLSGAAAATVCAATVVCAPYTAVVRELVMTAEHAVVDSEPAKVAARNIYNFFAQDKFIMLEQYQTYLARAIHTGELVKTFRQYSGDAELTQVGFTEEEKDGQDATAIAHNHRLGTPSTTAQDTHAAKAPQIHAKDPRINGVFHDCGPGHACPPPSHKDEHKLCPPGAAACRESDPPVGGHGSSGERSSSPQDSNGPLPCEAPGSPGCGSGAGIRSLPIAPGQPGNAAPQDGKHPLGGIDLNIQSVTVDSNSGTIAVLTENGSESDAPIAARDLAFALWLVYSGQHAAFSLDPADPKNPSGKWLKAVYYPESLRATAAGEDLFLGDWLLKQYAFGIQVVGDQIVQRHTATALKSIPQLMEATGPSTTRDKAAQWARMWIVVPRVNVRVTNGIARIVRVDMAVRARRQVPDPSSPTGLRDVDTDDDSIESQFAKQFSKLYTELGQTESPPLLRVRELAKAIAYAQWMKQQKIQVNMKEVVDLLNQQRVNAVDRVSALSVDWRKQEEQRVPIPSGVQVRTATRTIHIFGGVDLKVKPTFTEERAAGTLRDAVLAKLTLARSNKHVVVEHDGHRYQAFVMPFHVITR